MEAEPGRPADDSSLRSATAQGFLWTIGETVVVRLLSLVGFVVLARLLTPEEYGLAALASVFMVLLFVLGNAGMTQALVQRPSVDRTDLDSAFWVGTVTGAVLGAILALAAWPLADAFDEPDLRPVLQLLSLGFLFIGLGSTQAAVLQRDLAFKAISKSTVVANGVATVVGVAFAIAGFGVYALVIQTLLASVLLAIANAVQSGYRPGRQVSLARFGELFASGRHFLGNSFLAFTNSRTDDFLIGATLGSAALGIYSVGYRVLTIMLDVLITTARRVAFPVFSQLQGERERLAQAYASATRMAAVLAFPSFLFVLVAAPVIIPAIFGDRWEDSVPVMQVLCLFGPLFAVVQINTALLQSVGRARLVFRVGLVGTVLQVALFAVAVNFGIEWVAAAFVARAYLIAPFGLVAASRELQFRLRDHLAGLIAPLVSAVAMAGAVLVVREALDDRMPSGALLAVLIATGAISYAAVLRVVGAGVFAEVLAYLRSAVSFGRRKDALLQHHYYPRRRRAPVDPLLGVFGSYWYRGYGCNPAAIYEKARELVPGFRGVWVVERDRAATMPSGVEWVLPRGRPYYDLLARGGAFFNNVNFPDAVVKRPGSVHVMTHHGTPLKRMGFDLQGRPVRDGQIDFEALRRRCARWDYSVSANAHSTEVWEHAFPGSYESLDVGYPRNDVLVRATAADVERVRGRLGIAGGEQVVLYAPTHRADDESEHTALDLEAIAERLGSDWILLRRPHHFHATGPAHRTGGARIVDVAAHPSIADLCLAADVLVTDYSSVMFDYAILDRPVVVHAPDWEAYRATRGTYFDLLAAPPGVVTRTEDELVEALASGAAWADPATRAREAFRRRFCAFDDGHAAESVVRAVWGDRAQHPS